MYVKRIRFLLRVDADQGREVDECRYAVGCCLRVSEDARKSGQTKRGERHESSGEEEEENFLMEDPYLSRGDLGSPLSSPLHSSSTPQLRYTSQSSSSDGASRDKDLLISLSPYGLSDNQSKKTPRKKTQVCSRPEGNADRCFPLAICLHRCLHAYADKERRLFCLCLDMYVCPCTVHLYVCMHACMCV